MGLFSMFGSRKSIDTYVSEAAQNGAILVDVREASEFNEEHIKGALNIPMSTFSHASKKLSDKSATYYVYCLSGARSSRACSQLKAMGYEDVTNIGGIGAYHGPVVSGK